MDQMFGRKKASKTKTSTSESRLYLPQGATKASLLKPLKKMAAPNLSRSNSDTKLGHQKASLLTPSTDKAKSSVESKTEADNGRLYSTQSSPALLDLDLNEKSVRETASKPMPFVPIPLLRKSEHKPNASSYWRPQKPNNPPPDLDSIQRKSSENVHQNFCKKRPNSSKEDVNIEIDDLELENWPEKNIWTDSNGFSNFSDMDGIPDIMDIDYGEEPPPPGTEPNNAPTTFWTRQLDPVKRFMKSTLDSLQKVPRLINRSNDSSSEEESHENTVTSSLNEELQLRHILTLAYLDHFTLPGEELTEEELNKFMAMLVPEEDSERLLSEHITFYAENYANDNQLLVEVIYRALCNSEDEEVRSQSLGHLPTLMRFFERTGYKHHLLELLCAYINSIRRFDGGVEPQIEQKEQNLWEELNVPGTYSSNVLYLPLRKHSKSSKPTINQIMEVCYLVLSANFIDDERRNKIATTFTNFLDVIDKCTWKLRDEVFEFLADCLKFYHPDEYIQGHPIFEVFSHAALKNRADNRELAIKGLARIFELIFNNYSDEIAKSHSCVTLVILRTLVYTTLLENERNYRHRQRYYRFVVEVFELIGETTPVALLLQVFGMDVEAIFEGQ
ncbi:unnamed protein product [Bursaphelenchus okinawaensis]|uniref:Uncharacterized protein n=1 Tax=Bursaphelenchus okinawaensis TaxID=465554 RepID=A0A811KEG0_9BILA|nr:unnamed protein product [Bursaphelenchus okinawaensis]CAG9101709.1 unnamed protein product [Bursaphelenchus okinawaensis]